MSWTSPSPSDTRALARALADALPDEGLVVVLTGALGSGKTVFAKGLAEGLGIDPGVVASPTFVVANELPWARGILVHADFYRVESGAELEARGLHDWLAPGTLLLVEWGERFAEELPEDRLEVTLRPGADPDERRIEVRAGGPRARATLSAWSERCP